jgi:AcrR family transcriptional regulator
MQEVCSGFNDRFRLNWRRVLSDWTVAVRACTAVKKRARLKVGTSATTPRTSKRSRLPSDAIDLETKMLPSQARSRSTFEAILRVAGEILNDDGLDGLSVNAVVRRAGLTPPAVYRYFPNKYALLKALAERLMDAQDDAVMAVASRRELARNEAELAQELSDSIRAVAAVTTDFPGNVMILRALRVTPILKDVRRASTAKIATQRVERLRNIFPEADLAMLRSGVWLGIEIANALIDLIAEREWEAVGESRQATIEASAALLAHHYWQLGAAPKPGRSRTRESR